MNEQKSKDPNTGIFSDTSGQLSENIYLDWSIIYSIFDNDYISTITHDYPTFINISKSQLHCIAIRPPFMPYTDPVKCELDHAKPKQLCFEDHA